MSTTVQYKGNTLTTVSNATKTLKTAGKYMEGDVSITDSSGNEQGTVWQDAEGYLHLDDESGISLQTKTATPSESAQTIKPDAGYYALEEVNVGAISSSYVGSGITRRSSSDLTASGATVSVPSGYYASNASKAVSSGSATTPATTVTANPSISVNSSGLITATASATKSVTPTVSAGYVSSGTAGTITVSGSNTSQLSTQAGKTVTPTESEQTAVASGKYTTGAVKVGAISSTYVGSGITQRDSDDLTVSGATVTAPSGYYSASASKSVASGTAGTPTATKGTVSNHSVSITPSVTNTTGYITGSTKTGTAVTVSASELVNGTLSITQNGTNIDVTNYSTVSVAIESATGDYMAKATKSGTVTFTIQIGSGSRTNITDGAKYFFNSGDTITVRVVDGGSVYYNGTLVASNGQSTVSYSFTAPSNHLNIACSSDRIDIVVIGGGDVSIDDYKSIIERTATTPVLPSTLTKIGNYAFHSCTNLALTSLPSGVTSIGSYTFRDCPNLALTSLPSGLTSIGIYAFYGCTNLALTSLPDGVTIIGNYTFRDCPNLALTSLPSGVTSIGSYAFYGCTKLALTSLPDGVAGIGGYAFYNCTNIEILSIPSGVSTISGSTFWGCNKLETIILRKTNGICSLANVNALANTPIRGYNSLTGKIYVPSALIESYKTATNWSTIYNAGTVEFLAIEGSEYEE